VQATRGECWVKGEEVRLEVRLLSRLEELQKALEELSELQGKVASAQSAIFSF